jgi:signal transduction histidine kinase
MSAAASTQRGLGVLTSTDMEPATTEADSVAAARTAVQHAESALEKGEFETASVLAQQALALARQGDDPHLIGWSLMVLGRAQSNAGRTQHAHDAALEAYSLLGASGDITRQLWSLNTRAVSLIRSGDQARAIEVLHKGLILAKGPDRSAIRCVLLSNLGQVLCEEAEFAEAVACYAEASALAKQSPQRRGQWEDCATELAFARLQYANYLASRGLHDECQAQLMAAAAELPPLDCRSWRTFSMLEFACLDSRVRVLVGLGRWAEARQAAAACLGFGRRPGSGELALVIGCSAAALVLGDSGHLARAIRFETRALSCVRTDDFEWHPRILRRLAQLHAQSSDYHQALAYRKTLKALMSQQNRQGSALRSRLAAIERQAERRRYRENEQRVHMQRLAVIGRLIAQTHHALSTPAQQALALARRASAASGDAADIKLLMGELSRTIDRAAALVNQLKLFSYRSTPQPMALSLREALQSAWRGLEPHLDGRAARLQVEEDEAQPPPIWCDAQRLGIVLKLLLIELMQQTLQDNAPVTVRAHIEHSGDGAGVRLNAGSAALPSTPDLGMTLCKEIVAEMGGSLTFPSAVDATVCCYMKLPGAAQSNLPTPLAPPSVASSNSAQLSGSSYDASDQH